MTTVHLTYEVLEKAVLQDKVVIETLRISDFGKIVCQSLQTCHLYHEARLQDQAGYGVFMAETGFFKGRYDMDIESIRESNKRRYLAFSGSVGKRF